jgi:hypothetical protein
MKYIPTRYVPLPKVGHCFLAATGSTVERDASSTMIQSDTPSRIHSNADVFDFCLSDAQMTQLDALGDTGDAHITLWTLDLD